MAVRKPNMQFFGQEDTTVAYHVDSMDQELRSAAIQLVQQSKPRPAIGSLSGGSNVTVANLLARGLPRSSFLRRCV